MYIVITDLDYGDMNMLTHEVNYVSKGIWSLENRHNMLIGKSGY